MKANDQWQDWWRRYGRLSVLLVAVYLVITVVPPPRYGGQQAVGQSCSRHGFTASFVDAVRIEQSPETDERVCMAATANGIAYAVYVLTATDPDKTLDLATIQGGFLRETGAGRYPVVMLDRRHLLSSINYLRHGAITPDLFVNDAHERGFLQFVASDRRTVIVEFLSEGAREPEEVLEGIQITTNSESWFNILLIMTILLSPAIVVLVMTVPGKPKRTLWRAVDMSRATGFEPALLLLLIPVAVPLAFWAFGFQTTGFAAAVAAVLLLGSISIRSWSRRLARPTVTLAHGSMPHPFFRLWRSKTTTTVAYAPVRESLDFTVTVWIPHRQQCGNCHSEYFIHTPSRVERNVFAGAVGGSDGKSLADSTLKEMVQEATKDTKPPVNGCPYCGNRSHISKESLAFFGKRARRQTLWALVIAGIGIAGSAGLFFLGMNAGSNSSVFMGLMNVASKFSPYSLQDTYVAGIVTLFLTFYGAYRIRKGRDYEALWVCPTDGFLFENLEQRDGDEQVCLACKTELRPIQDVIVVGAKQAPAVSSARRTRRSLHGPVMVAAAIVAVGLIGKLVVLPALERAGGAAEANRGGLPGGAGGASEDPALWNVTLSGLGPIRVGTTREALEAVTGSRLSTVSELKNRSVVYDLSGLPDAAVVLAGERVKAIRITGSWRTRSGLKVGDTEAQVLRLYGDKVVPRQGETGTGLLYEFVPRDEQDARLRVIFATSDGRVSAICAGELPEVAELCGVSGAAVSTNLRVADLVATGMVSGCGCVVHPLLSDGQAAGDRYLFFSDAACRAWLNVDGRDVMLQAEGRRMNDGASLPEADCARSSEYRGDGVAVHVDRKEIADCPPFSTGCETTTYDVTITVRKDGSRQVVRGLGGCRC